MPTNINYQQIYEEELAETVKDSLEKPRLFADLSHQDKMMIQDLVDIGYSRAIDDALDPQVLADTRELAAEMGTQLYNFANLLHNYTTLSAGNVGEED